MAIFINKIIYIFFKITLIKVSNANVYICKQFYTFFKIILNKRCLVFKTQGLCYHELIFCKQVNLQKPRYQDGSQDESYKRQIRNLGRIGFLEQGHFDKHFMYERHTKEGLRRKTCSCFFSKILLKQGNFSKSGQFFSIFKKRQGRSLPSLLIVARLSCFIFLKEADTALMFPS